MAAPGLARLLPLYTRISVAGAYKAKEALRRQPHGTQYLLAVKVPSTRFGKLGTSTSKEHSSRAIWMMGTAAY